MGNATLPVIWVEQAANMTSTVNIGEITEVENNADSDTGLAIFTDSTGGSVVVNDAGFLIGDVNFKSLIDPPNTIMNITGYWGTAGTDTFAQGNGTDSVTVGNTTGEIETTANTTFVYGNLSTNSLSVLTGGELKVDQVLNLSDDGRRRRPSP